MAWSAMGSEEESVLAMFLLMAAQEEDENRDRRRRRVWSRRLLLERPLRGERAVLMEFEKRADPGSFYAAYRMTPNSFDELVLLLDPHLEKENTAFREPIGVAERLGITLRYLGTGMSQRDVARHFCVGRSTACVIIREVTQVIWEILGPLYMARPTTEDWKRIAKEFGSRWNFPGCLGAVDGKHIHIQKPRLSGSLYYNYKKTFSEVLMAVADADYKFIYLDIGSYGRENDSSVFARSTFGKALLDGTLSLPEPDGSPYAFVADEAFPLQENLMRPYPGNTLNEEKRVFNYRLSRARRVVENSFGIMVTKWRILRQPIIGKPETIDGVIKAIGVLHNFLREREGVNVDFAEGSGHTLDDAPRRMGANNYSSAAENVRQTFVDYFNSPQGSLPYQNDVVHRGELR